MDWKKNLGADEQRLDGIRARVEQHKEAIESAEQPEIARLWTALSPIQATLRALVPSVRRQERITTALAAEWLKAKRTEKVVIKREPVVVRREIDYQYGFGSWMFSIILIFLASLILVNISWIEGTTIASFWIAVLVAFAFLSIAGFVLMRSVSQMF